MFQAHCLFIFLCSEFSSQFAAYYTRTIRILNLQVLRELREVLSQLKRDEGCRVVLLTSAGSSFCQGIDFHSLLHTNADKRRTAAQDLAQALK